MNPWEKISLDDYENHMKLNTVFQLQTMNEMMKDQFYRYPAKSVMVLGIAGGNGLEHINTEIIDKVYGVDINENYLEECHNRYSILSDIFETICTDLMNDVSKLPNSDLLVANLLIEYIGYENFKKAVLKVNPKYVSCIIQINTDEEFVSDSPYLHVFDNLEEVHYQMAEKELADSMKEIDYELSYQTEKLLPNGKKLVRLDFTRK